MFTTTLPAHAADPRRRPIQPAARRTSKRIACDSEPPHQRSAPNPHGPTTHHLSNEAFTLLVGQYLRELLAVAKRQLGCEHLAWEAVQDALVSLWDRAESPPQPKAWLIRAVLFRSLHLRRTIRRRARHEHLACLARTETLDARHPADSLIAEEIRSEVRAALARLAEPYRDVLTLHLIDGLSYETIAGRLDIPIGTVRSRIARARQALIIHLRSDQDSA